MLKFIFMTAFILIFYLLKKNFWMVQMFLFITFFWILINVKISNYFVLMGNFLGVDLISLGLILLSVWIIVLMFMASNKVFKLNLNIEWYTFMMMFLLLMLILCFSVTNFFLYYFFFESSLIPVFFLILGWGYQSERLQAGYYLLFYTLLASLPLLLSIFYCIYYFNSMQFYCLKFDLKLNLLYFSLIGAFLVKMPMFFVHLWLPKAHVEAPISGSMILAGVLLKLGGYGLLRIFIILQLHLMSYNLLWYLISLFGGVLISLVCLCQVDMKSLIAYSSVAHMGIVISGLMTLSMWGYLGSYVLMIGHGLCSSGLFCLSNIVYERTGSRSLFINKGLINYMPSLALWWFLLCSSNMAAPPSLNLVGEIMLLNSIISWSYLSMFLLAFLSFFSAAYSLYLFSYSQQGQNYSMGFSFSLSNSREYMLVALHWIPLNILILKLDLFIYWI